MRTRSSQSARAGATDRLQHLDEMGIQGPGLWGIDQANSQLQKGRSWGYP